MKHTVIALFDQPAQARKAADALAAQGFISASVHAASAPDGDTQASEPLPAAVAIEGGPGGGLMHRLAVLFGVDDDPHVGHYQEAVRRGGSVVEVEADGETEATRARDALLSLGAVNIDDRLDVWRQAGWDGDGTVAASPAGAGARSVEQAGMEGSEIVSGRPRDAAVHRQDVSIGGVRVYGHRAVQGFEDQMAGFRDDYAMRYAADGGSYDDYDPAYRYGHGLASDARYGDRDWDDFEADARRDWEARYPGSAWERFKGAVRHAWERATR